MIGAEERALLADYLAVCARLREGFIETCEVAQAFMPVDAASMDALPTRDTTWLLAFLKRFEQFEDALHRTLKAISRIMEHGRIERLTSVDVTRRAHALGILDDERIWADAVRARNALAHEYPLNAVKRAAQVNAVWNARDTLLTTSAAIERFVEKERLL